jgi:hypothetical protein
LRILILCNFCNYNILKNNRNGITIAYIQAASDARLSRIQEKGHANDLRLPRARVYEILPRAGVACNRLDSFAVQFFREASDWPFIIKAIAVCDGFLLGNAEDT